MKFSGYLGIVSITSLVAISLFVTGCESKTVTSNLGTSSPSPISTLFSVSPLASSIISPSLTPIETIKTEEVESLQVVGGFPGKQQDILAHTPEPKLNVTVSKSINGLNDILKLLSSQKDIFNIKESPNKKYVAYLHSDTATAYEKLTLHLWRVGEPRPLETSKIEEENVGDVLWSPNSDYVFVDKGTSVIRSGDLFLVEGLKKITFLGYYHAIYFSPDGKKILIGSTNDKISTIKSKYISPENIVSLSIYDIDTNKLTTVYKGTDNEDYHVIGWLDDETISYHLNNYSDPNGMFKVDFMKFKYDLKTQKSVIDEPKINKSANGKDGISIGIELGKEKDIFNETWSPDRGTVVYGKGNNNEGLGKIYMWRVGEEKPSQIVPNDTGYPIGNFSWSPNSEFFTINIAVAPESGVYLIRVNDQKTTRILCFLEPFFSVDSKFLLFSGLENIQSVYKVAGSGVSLNISILDLNTLKTSVLIPSTDKINYTSLGWAGTNKVMYRKYDFSTKMDEILEYDFKKNG